MIIDIHCHILPGVDDGARDMEETIKMLEIAVEEGIGAMVATPHYEVGNETDEATDYHHSFEKVLQYIREQQLPLELYAGNEIFYTESIPEMLQSGVVRTINGTRYVLVEFSIETGYQTIERAISNLLYAGYWPVIAHAERYIALRNVKRVQELVRLGACIQMNTRAIVGKEGWQVKRFCLQLLKKGLVHVVATDAHGSIRRRPMMHECLQYIDKKMGKAYRRRITEDNPMKMLEGEKISGKD